MSLAFRVKYPCAWRTLLFPSFKVAREGAPPRCVPKVPILFGNIRYACCCRLRARACEMMQVRDGQFERISTASRHAQQNEWTIELVSRLQGDLYFAHPLSIVRRGR